MNPQTDNQQVVKCIELLENVLGSDLIGIYLYGSSLVGGLQLYSDIDLFVVSNRATFIKDKVKLSQELLQISGIYRNQVKRPIDLIIAVQSEINPWHYPPKFDYHYGDWMRHDFESGNYEPWTTNVMPSLALLITQVLLSSKTVFGPKPDQLLAQIPYKDVIGATINELDNLKADLPTDTRNVLLSFARIWLTVETDTISSKRFAADWSEGKLPDAYKPLMRRARDASVGEQSDTWEDMAALLLPCADFMIGQINKRTSQLLSSDLSKRMIKLAE